MNRRRRSGRWAWMRRLAAVLVSIAVLSLALGRPSMAGAVVPELRLVGNAGGRVDAIDLSGPYLYAAVGARLAVLTAETEPVAVGMSPPVPHRFGALATWGGYVYGASRAGTIQVFDVRRPEAPMPTTTLSLPADRFSLHLLATGSRLYASSFWCDSAIGPCPDDDLLAPSWRKTTRIFDIADPGRPIEMGTVDDMYGPLVSDGTRIYALDLLSGLHVYEPGNDVLLRELGALAHPQPDYYTSLASDGARIYASRRGFADDAIDVIGVSLTGTLTLLATTTVPGSIGGLAFADGHLYGLSGQSVCVYEPDISPTVRLIARHELPNAPGTLKVREQLVFVGGDLLMVLDVSRTDETRAVTRFGGSCGGHDIDVAPGLAVTALGAGGVHIYDTSAVSEPTLVKLGAFGGFADQVRLRDGLLFVSGGWQSGLARYDLRDPTQPLQLDTYWPEQPPVNPRLKINPGLFAVGDTNVHLVAERSNSMNGSLAETHSMEVVDPVSPGGPTAIGSVRLAHGDVELQGHPMIEQAGTKVAAASGMGLLVLDVANPLAPEVVGSHVSDSEIRDIVAVPDGIAIAVDSGLRLLDLAEPSAPTPAGFLSSDDLGGAPSGMSSGQLVGRSLVSLVAGDAIAVVDVSSIWSPRLVSRSRDLSSFQYYATALIGSHVMATTRSSGLHVFKADSLEGITVHSVAIPYARASRER